MRMPPLHFISCRFGELSHLHERPAAADAGRLRLFAGGSGDWPTALQIAGDWYEQSNLSAHENPMRALMEMNDNVSSHTCS